MYTLNVIERNFLKLLKYFFTDRHVIIEPMTIYKWNRIIDIIENQDIKQYLFSSSKQLLYYPKYLHARLESNKSFFYRNSINCFRTKYLQRRYERIEKRINKNDLTQLVTFELLNMIVINAVEIINNGVSLNKLIKLAIFLRSTESKKTDKQLLYKWISKLNLIRMAELQGSFLIYLFDFSIDEIPFSTFYDKEVKNIIHRIINHKVSDIAEEWNFKQTRSGFVMSNSKLLRRNLKRSIRYFKYAPIETISCFFHNFIFSLSEIEE